MMKQWRIITAGFLVMLLLGACGAHGESSGQARQVLSDGITAVLPEQLTVADRDETACLFVSSDEAVTAHFQTLARPLANAGWCHPGGTYMYQGGGTLFHWQGGEIAGATLPWNHAECIGQGEAVTEIAVPVYVMLVQHDLYTAATLAQAEQQDGQIPAEQQTVSIWHAFLALPDQDKMLDIWLNAELFGKETFMAMVQSIMLEQD